MSTPTLEIFDLRDLRPDMAVQFKTARSDWTITSFGMRAFGAKTMMGMMIMTTSTSIDGIGLPEKMTGDRFIRVGEQWHFDNGTGESGTVVAIAVAEIQPNGQIIDVSKRFVSTGHTKVLMG